MDERTFVNDLDNLHCYNLGVMWLLLVFVKKD